MEPNPFRTLEALPGRTTYCTGDLVRAVGDGAVEFIGRIDRQIKIRGHRVELDEVSRRLEALLDAEVATVARLRPEPHLRAFYRSPVDAVNADQAMQALRRNLPDYMLPQSLTRLDAFPLTPNGKLDVKRLAEMAAADPAPPPTQARGASAQAVGPLEDLRRLIADVLELEVVDAHAPLGWYGLNSLSYNVLSVQVERRFGVAIGPQQFYRLRTLAAVAELIARRGARAEVHLPRRPAAPASAADDLAVVGLSLVMPGGLDADGFWDALAEGRDLVGPSGRAWLPAGMRAGFLPDVDRFDERFFSISPLEAAQIDPRQRLLLQEAWRAFEDAGYSALALGERVCGCYVAATGMDHAMLGVRRAEPSSVYELPGNAMAMLSNRLSYFFDWRGPSFTIDTACSGSLNALVKACRDLRSGVTDVALVGAANLILDNQLSDGLAAGRFLSPSSRCATFDASADGYVRGEGVCCVVVKRLADATADGDAIHGVVKSVAENHGGRAASLTAPNPLAQEQLYLQAYTPELAAQVSFIETHGTGTALGDPVEVEALQAAWRALAVDGPPERVGLGALKSNIGHLEAASGLAGVAKVLLALRHRQLPPNLHFNRLNPHIRLDGGPFRVVDALQAWDRGRAAGGGRKFLRLRRRQRPRRPGRAADPASRRRHGRAAALRLVREVLPRRGLRGATCCAPS